MSLFKPLRGDSSRISTDITPFHDGWCYFTSDEGGFYIDVKKEDGTEDRVRINPDASMDVQAVLSAGSWANKKQVLTVSEVTADQNGVIGVAQNATPEQSKAAKEADLKIQSQADGSLTISANGTIPNCDIPVTLVLFS